VLGLADTEERAHHNHPDFRVRGKIFATMGFPDASRAMLILTPEQQAESMHDHPEVFTQVSGKWGEKGCTSVHLPKATKAALQPAATAAYQNALQALAAATSKKRKRP
jgi:hypothetical protein